MLDHCALRREVPAQHGDAAFGTKRPFARHDDVGVAHDPALDVRAERPAVHRHAVHVQQIAHLIEEPVQPAGIVEVLHQILAGRPDVGEKRRAPRQRVESVEIERRTGAAGHRDQMNDGVGRTTERHRGHHGVLECRSRQDLAGLQILPHHLDDAAAGGGGHAGMRGIGGGDRRGAGQRQAERIDSRRHGGRRSHRHAGAERAREAVLHLAPGAFVEHAGAALGPVLPQVGARPEQLAAPVPAQHRTGRNQDRRQVHARRAHHERRRRLVAACHQDDPVDGIGAERFFRVHGEQVAIHHRARLHERFAERQQRDLHRESAGLPDAALHFLRSCAEVRVAGVGVTPGVEDRDDRLAADVVEAEARLLHAGPVSERSHVVLAEPAMASQIRWLLPRSGHTVCSRSARATGARRSSCVRSSGETNGGMEPVGAMPASSVP